MDRRTFLRGTGVAIALPWLEAMGVHSTSFSKAGNWRPAKCPARAVFTCWGLGMNPSRPFPKRPGSTTSCRSRSSRWSRSARRRPTSPACTRSPAATSRAHCFLTGVDPHKGKYGISCDQVIAESLGGKTRFPSLCLSHTRQTGFGGDGQHTLSWTKNRTPVMPEDRPQVLFDRLFRPDSPPKRWPPRKHRAAEQGSVLDAVREQARRLEGRLGQDRPGETAGVPRLDPRPGGADGGRRPLAAQAEAEGGPGRLRQEPSWAGSSRCSTCWPWPCKPTAPGWSPSTCAPTWAATPTRTRTAACPGTCTRSRTTTARRKNSSGGRRSTPGRWRSGSTSSTS